MSGTTLNSSGGGGLADGDYGDITVGGSGTTLTIDNGAVTLAKIASAAANSKLLGSGAAGSGSAYVEITLGTNLSMSGTTLNASGGGGSLSDGDYGDITVGGSGTTLTIDNDAVTYAKMQNVSAASKLLGRGSAGGSGDPEEITLGTNLSMSGTTLNASSSGGAAWALAGSGQTATGVYDFAVDGAKANIDFTGLGSFNELMILARGLSWSVSGARVVHVSVNNGSTFYSASGDYVTLDNTGTETNTTVMGIHSTNSASARSLFSHILNLKGPAKMASNFSNTSYPPALRIMFVASSSDINAIRVTSTGGGNSGAGTVRVYAR
jgi:hypothetical protein